MRENQPNVHFDTTGKRAFSVHDVGFSKNNGREIEGYLSYSVNNGPLCSSTFGYIEGQGGYGIDFKETHLAAIAGLVEEVVAEAKEAAAYRRDELKGMN